MPPVVSVLLPTYERNSYLAEALESVLRQTYQDFEVIVSDNSASSDTEALVQSFSDERVRYRHNGANIGAPANIVAAHGASRGRYISILHDDDRWAPDFLETLVAPLEADPRLVLAFSDYYLMTSDGAVDSAWTDRNTRAWGRAGLREGVHMPFYGLALSERALSFAVAAVSRKSAVDFSGIPAAVGVSYDTWLSYVASRDGSGAYYSAKRLTSYRSHEGSITAGARNDSSVVYCYETFLADPRLRSIRADLRRVAGHFHAGVGISLTRERQRRRAVPHLLKGLLWSRDIRAVAGLGLCLLPRPELTDSVLSFLWRLRHRHSKRAVLW